MAYDLFFHPQCAASPVSHAVFVEYFQRRLHYEVQGLQAWYSNEDTGVYFSFEYNEAISADLDDEDVPSSPLYFNMNYFRPHVFGLEAEPEVAALVRNFEFLIDDPQGSGMGQGEYSREGFLRGWNAGNEFAYQALLSDRSGPPADIWTLPAARIEQCWNWNYQRQARQRELGEDTFVPKIVFIREAIDRLIRRKAPWEFSPKLIANDKVLDAELAESARGGIA